VSEGINSWYKSSIGNIPISAVSVVIVAFRKFENRGMHVTKRGALHGWDRAGFQRWILT
jgi:hypothetical protein